MTSRVPIPINTQLSELHRDIGRLRQRTEAWAERKVEVLEAVIASLERLRELDKAAAPAQKQLAADWSPVKPGARPTSAAEPFNDELPPF